MNPYLTHLRPKSDLYGRSWAKRRLNMAACDIVWASVPRRAKS